MVHAKEYARISIDIRIIPVPDYKDLGLIFKRTAQRQMDFTPGSYFSSQEAHSGMINQRKEGEAS